MNRIKTIGLHIVCIVRRPASTSFHLKGVARALFTDHRINSTAVIKLG